MTETSATSLSNTGQRFYQPELDTIRFLAFVSVFFVHMLPNGVEMWVRHGLPEPVAAALTKIILSLSSGVDLFFLLSSYLITMLLLRERKLTGTIDLRSFYIRRALRIWPLYYAFLAFAFLVLPRLGYPAIPREHLISFPLFFGNWTTAFSGLISSPAAPLWSVSIEEQFYIAWPLLLMLFGTKHLRLLAVSLFVIAVVSRLLLANSPNSEGMIFYGTFSRLDPIAGGALIACWFSKKERRLGTFERCGMLAAGTLMLPATFLLFEIGGYGASFNYPLRAVACSLILLAAITGPVPRLVKCRPLAYLGKISYGLYVYHMLVVDLSWRFVAWPGTLGLLTAMASALVVVILIAAAAFVIVLVFIL